MAIFILNKISLLEPKTQNRVRSAINQRSVSFFKGRQSDYMGMDDPQLEALVLQWRRTLEPEQRKAISADIQRRLAEQLEWVNVTTYPFFQRIGPPP